MPEKYQEGDLEKFFGCDPDFTGDMSTEDHVDSVRGGIDAELARLRSEVVEAAKDFWEFGSMLYAAKLDAAVESLLEFESENCEALWQRGSTIQL